MANRRLFMAKRALRHYLAESEANPQMPAARKSSSADRRPSCRVRYDTRIEPAQGWRSSFMSF